MAEYTLVADRTGDLRLSAEEKRARYEELLPHLEAVVGDDPDPLAAMASTVCLLLNAFPYYYWTGFCRRVAEAELLVGPYQGTLGCLRIACDSASASEIVVPVLDARDELIAVLDVDSTLPAAFDEVDRHYLERAVRLLRDREPLPVVWR